MKKKKITFYKLGFGRTIKQINTRTGKTNLLRDKKRTALPPGKRISKNGKIYYEKRKNRSDIINTKI